MKDSVNGTPRAAYSSGSVLLDLVEPAPVVPHFLLRRAPYARSGRDRLAHRRRIKRIALDLGGAAGAALQGIVAKAKSRVGGQRKQLDHTPRGLDRTEVVYEPACEAKPRGESHYGPASAGPTRDRLIAPRSSRPGSRAHTHRRSRLASDADVNVKR